jgi:voltage-gated sodium channel
VKSVYTSNAFQAGAATAIFINFTCNVLEAEVNPEHGTTARAILENFDFAFVIIFTMELCVNIFANWMKDFITDAWCWFDFIVVVVALVNHFMEDNSHIDVLRTARAFRVFRLFRKLKSLRQIINAINASLPAVLNAFLLVVLMTMIYAIIGTTFIRFIDPDNFGIFSVSMYTMFRIMTFDDAEGLARANMDLVEGSDKVLIVLFIVTYQLAVAYILCNIVMAVLLDEFGTAVETSKSEDAEDAIALLAINNISVVDPLLEQLCQAETEGDLQKQIQEIFRFIDEDSEGYVDFIELRNGLKRLDTDPPIDFKV